jgi:urate oxidase
MKDKNFIDKDYEKELKSTDATRRMAAAMAMAKLGKLDLTQYKDALKDFENNDAFKKLYDGEVAKKNVHLIIDSEIEQAKTDAAKAGGTMTQAQKNDIIDKHINNLAPEQLAKQNVTEIIATEKRHGSDKTRDLLLDWQTNKDPKKQVIVLRRP